MSRRFAILATIALLIGAMYGYEKARAEYDPEAVCVRQKKLGSEQCLSAIDLAMSSGW